ncbi:glycine cleavage system T protein [Kipferlia bialata]|uniref:Aminomethyltransferase n=1 Tax=Kipferlia bialata TaxID=797122 RepID=A0A9K3GF72_9EUKA|nr:glycine cleavage system T protein [Kipferlia bialata]GIQ80532.1 glycine cleavage system T protein [Kipferlia bialata]|eukprot:g481.t1
MLSSHTLCPSYSPKTPLWNLHNESGGDMVSFGGWSLPVKYRTGIIESHAQCRETGGLFDVSHMTQLMFTGADRELFLETITPADIQGLKERQMRLSSYLTPDGGIIDDLMVVRHSAKDQVFLISNAATKENDVKHLNDMLQKYSHMDVQIEDLSFARALIAVQGPGVKAAMQRLLDYDFTAQPFMSQFFGSIEGIDVWVARSGYTGMDGVEISVDAKDGERLARILLAQPEIEAAGLGPRDSLRMEGGLCLYGSDIDTTTNPIEAGLSWTISKRRKEEGGYIGAEAVNKVLEQGVVRRRVGLVIEKGAPARAHSKIYAADKETLIGHVTSGIFSPTLKKPISMGYVNVPHHKKGTQVFVEVRGKMLPASIKAMPFVEAGFYRGGSL